MKCVVRDFPKHWLRLATQLLSLFCCTSNWLEPQWKIEEVWFFLNFLCNVSVWLYQFCKWRNICSIFTSMKKYHLNFYLNKNFRNSLCTIGRFSADRWRECFALQPGQLPVFILSQWMLRIPATVNSILLASGFRSLIAQCKFIRALCRRMQNLLNKWSQERVSQW